jgi:hypothetical protein
MNSRRYLKGERTTALTNNLNFFWSYYGKVAQLVDTYPLIAVASALALGFALVRKDYVASFIAGIVFESNPEDPTDVRSNILREFLEKERKETKVSGKSSGNYPY